MKPQKDLRIDESWYEITNVSALDSPALLLYKDRLEHNIALANAMVGDVTRLRPHVKTHKSSKITQCQLAAGITRFKCATLGEARMLARAGAPDILLAFPLYGPRAEMFLGLQAEYPNLRFSVIVDATHAAQQLSQLAVAHQTRVRVYVDLDIGMGRTGAPISAASLDLVGLCHSLDGLQLVGVHAYDGHVRERDAVKLYAQCDQNYTLLQDFVEQARKSCQLPSLEVIVGGSPSFPYYAVRPEVQCSPGTYVLWDQGYAQDCPQQEFLPAAVVLCRVISLPSPTTICVDLGHKAVAAEQPIDKRVTFLNAPDLRALRQSEEHLVLEAPLNHGYMLGQALYGVPYHVCPTVNLYSAYNIVEQGKVVDQWPIDARDRFAFVG